MRFLLAIFVLPLSVCIVGQTQAVENAVNETPASADRIMALVEQLGHDQFSRRESAMEQLIKIGVPAMPAVRAGSQHVDREIRYRARRILSVVDDIDRRRRMNAFLAGRDTESADGLPGWVDIRKRFGSGRDVRSVFVEMLDDEWEFLEAVELDKSSGGNLLADRCQQLHNAQRSFGQQISLGSIAAMLFVASDESVVVPMQTSKLLYTLCYQQSFRKAMTLNGSRTEVFRKLLGTWVGRGGDGSAHQGMYLALQYNLREGLVPARKVLESSQVQPHIRQNAILVFAKMGMSDDVKFLQTFLSDETTCSTSRVKNKVRQTQIRDVALAAILHLSKQELKEFGFDRVQLNANSVFHANSLGFETDEDRQKAIQKWRDSVGGTAE